MEDPGVGVRGRRHTRVVPYDYSYRQTQHSVQSVLYQPCEKRLGLWKTKEVIFWEWAKESQKALKWLIFELLL